MKQQTFEMGDYATEDEAAFAYNVAALVLEGPNAELNRGMNLTLERKKEIEKKVLQQTRAFLELPREFKFDSFPRLYEESLRPRFQARPLPPKEERDQIEVFDFEKNWHLIQPHLPAAVPALTTGLNKYFQHRAEECIYQGQNPSGWQMNYDPKEGPWAYSSTDFWFTEMDDRANEAVERGDIKWDPPGEHDDDETVQKKFEEFDTIRQRFAPKPYTPEWYQLHLAGAYLVPWQLMLGRLALPHLVWEPVTSFSYSLAAGFENGKMRTILDIISFKRLTASELLAMVEREPYQQGEGDYAFSPQDMLRAAEIAKIN